MKADAGPGQGDAEESLCVRSEQLCERQSTFAQCGPPAAHVTEKEPLRDQPMTIETTAIGLYTLHFTNPELEEEWTKRMDARRRKVIYRFLAAALFYQAMFGISDTIDSPDIVYLTTPVRMSCAIGIILFFILTTLGLVEPRKPIIFGINMVYGLCTLLIYALQRKTMGHWDALFNVYGIAFFVLPRITPLDFFYSFLGSFTFSGLFMYISLYRLPWKSWVLSSVLLIIPLAMLNYVSYSSEKAARERWLLKQRLEREKIQLELMSVDDRDSSMVLSMSRPNIWNRRTGPSHAVQNKKFTLLKGFGLWVGLSMLGWFTSSNLPEMLKLVDSSVAWAVFTHAVGFSFFLVIVTGQLRWVIVVGFVSGVILWISSAVIPNNWMIFTIHSIGYILLAAAFTLMLGVFGGVVYVWSEVIDFMKRMCQQYPQIQENLKDSPILEQVFVPQLPYLVDLSGEASCPGIGEGQDPKDRHVAGDDINAHRTLRHRSSPKNADKDSRSRGRLIVQQNSNYQLPMVEVLSGRKRGACMFCSSPEIAYYLPACNGWKQNPKGSSCSGSKVQMCTPYTSLLKERDLLITEKNVFVNQLQMAHEHLANEVARCKRAEQKAEQYLMQIASAENRRAAEIKAMHTKMELEVLHIKKEREHLIAQLNDRVQELRQLHRGTKKSRHVAATTAGDSFSIGQDAIVDESSSTDAQCIEHRESSAPVHHERASTDTHTSESTEDREHHDSSCKTDQAVTLQDFPHISFSAGELSVRPPRRLPYAQLLELEGMKESATQSSHSKSRHFR